MKSKRTKSAFGIIIAAIISSGVFIGVEATADTIHFPQEDLPQESVLPIFDRPDAVKQRLVPFKGRFEVGGMLGLTLTDPFFNSMGFGADIAYHITDVHAIALAGMFFSSSQTSYVSQIQAVGHGGASIPFSQAPYPKSLILGQYEFTPWYGKISLTKSYVMNLSLSATLGIGNINVNTTSSFAGEVGLNERFFFTPNLGLKADLAALFYQQPDIVNANPTTSTNETNIILTVGLQYLFPNM